MVGPVHPWARRADAIRVRIAAAISAPNRSPTLALARASRRAFTISASVAPAPNFRAEIPQRFQIDRVSFILK